MWVQLIRLVLTFTLKIGLHNTTSRDDLVVSLNGSPIESDRWLRQPYPGSDPYVAQLLLLTLDRAATGVNVVRVELRSRPEGLATAVVIVTDVELLLRYDKNVFGIGGAARL